MKFVIGILICVSMLIAADIEKQFSVETISIEIYDNSINKVVQKPVNEYGNNMDLFIAVRVSQNTDNVNKYKLELTGYGKGRENDAEGLVEDYHVDVSKSIVLYSNDARYIPFIVEYPCTLEETFIVTLTNEEGKRVSRKVKNKLTRCYLN